MNKNFLTGALGLIALGLVVGAGFQQREIRALNRQIAAARFVANTTEREHAERLAHLRDEHGVALAEAHREAERLQDTLRNQQQENDRLARTLAQSQTASEDRLAVASPPALPVSDDALLEELMEPHGEDDDDDASEEAPISQMAKMMKEPAMREFMRAQQRTMVDMTYKSLYDTLELDTDTMERLKKLLLDKQMADMEMGLDMMAEDLTPEQREELRDKHEAARAESERALRELLGQRDYEWYESYEQTKAERIQLSMFNQSLETALRLRPDQEDALALTLYEARSQHDYASRLQDPEKMDPSQFTEEGIAALLQDMKAVNQQAIARAANILTPEQHKQFIAFLEQQHAMQEMGMKMSLRMFKKD